MWFVALRVHLVLVKTQNPCASLNIQCLEGRQHLGFELKCSVSMTIWHRQSQKKTFLFCE